MATVRKNPVYSRNSKGKQSVITYRYQVSYKELNKRARKNFKDKKTAYMFKNQVELKEYMVDADLVKPMRPNLTFEDMVDEYLTIIDKRKKPRTIARERTVFRTFQIFIPRNIRIRDITSSLIRHYVAYRNEECDVRPATINAELRTLKTFMNILITHEYVQVNPLIGVKMLPIVKTEPHTFTDAEILRLFSAIDDSNYWDLIKMYLHTGARREELLPDRLEWKDIDIETKTIRLTGKFDKSRYVPLTETALEIVTRRQQNKANKYPFDFNYHYLYKKIKKYMAKAGITTGTLHSMRRTHASRMIQNGTTIQYASRLLGHEKIDVTDRAYIHVVTNDLRKEVAILDEIW